MGDWTAIATDITFKADTPKFVLDIIRHLVGEGHDEVIQTIPKHHYFTCDRWDSIFTMSSTYFDFDTDSVFDGNKLMTVANLKNYPPKDGKHNHTPIESFFDWVWPHCDISESNIIGCSKYDNYDYDDGGMGTIYMIKDNKLQTESAKVSLDNTTRLITERQKLLEHKNG